METYKFYPTWVYKKVQALCVMTFVSKKNSLNWWLTFFNVSWMFYEYSCTHGYLVMFNSLWPHGPYPVRFLWPWNISRQEYWSVLPFPPPGIPPDPGTRTCLLHPLQWQAVLCIYLLCFVCFPSLHFTYEWIIHYLWN